MHLVPAEAQRRDHVGGSVRFREHVLNLIAGLDVPIRHVVLLHCGDVLLREELFRVALTGDFHNLKRHFRLKAFQEQVGHDAVSRTDDGGDGAGAVFDEVLRVADPNIRAVGQTRNLQKVGECLRLGIDEHLAHERRAALRQRERAR